MTMPSLKLSKPDIERSFIKPSSSICKSLFDSSDPSETKRMVQAMVISERRRLEHMWDFDPRIQNSAENAALTSGENGEKSSMSCHRKYEWKLQDREKVPYFYTRPYRFLNSKPVQLDKESTANLENILQSESSSFISLPFNRDENTNPGKREVSRRTSSRKRVPNFTNPPKISSGNLDPSLVRFVTALRVPLSSAPQQTGTLRTSNPETPESSDAVQQPSNPSITAVSPTESEPADESKSTLASSALVTSKTPASRQLFPTKKRDAHDTSKVQPKITDVIPLRKVRQNASKRRRLTNSTQLSSTSQ